jgi:caffeoyl-CoA O-methyltransferase
LSNRTIAITDALYDYLLGVSLREPELLRRLRRETAVLPQAGMQISPEQGQFLAFLVRTIEARRVLEIGTFTGYSSLCMALALPSEGRIVACDTSDQWTRIARRYWTEAGVAGRVDLHLAPAIETLDRLAAAGEEETFDFAFIDADKENYTVYFERSLRLMRPGGVIAVDNVLWGGSVIDPAKSDADTMAIRSFNAALHDDQRVDISLVPIGDGLTLARKRRR